MNGPLADAQNSFHEQLTRYVNGQFASRATWLLSMLTPGAAYRREAAGVIAAFRATAPARTPAGAVVDVTVPVYRGDNPQARELMRALAPLEPLLAGAYVHGSIATGEEVAYSDFDALVILRDAAFESPATLARVAERLGALRRLMFEYDPLQHHGWFVLAEANLQNHCQAWFPTVLFTHSRSLLPETGTRLRIRPRNSIVEHRAAFANLAASTLRQVEAGRPPDSAYALKGMLSQFMLLPSLYLQARDGTAVFKRESFALAARDFPPELWRAMDSVSALRLAWRYDMSALRRLALTRLVASRRLVTRWLPPAVPDALQRAAPPDLWRDIAALIRAMQARIHAAESAPAGPGP